MLDEYDIANLPTELRTLPDRCIPTIDQEGEHIHCSHYEFGARCCVCRERDAAAYSLLFARLYGMPAKELLPNYAPNDADATITVNEYTVAVHTKKGRWQRYQYGAEWNHLAWVNGPFPRRSRRGPRRHAK